MRGVNEKLTQANYPDVKSKIPTSEVAYMNNFKLYHKWREWLTQHLPDDCSSRLTNLTHFMIGLFRGKSVHLPKIARELPIDAQKLSIVRRLRRFLDNEAVDVRDWYHPWADWLLRSAASGGQLNLIIDGSKVTSSHQLLCVSVAWRRRALPIVWTWLPYPRGHSRTDQQIELLETLRAMIPDNDGSLAVSLVGDSEFGRMRVLELLDLWGWSYSLRQAKNERVLLPDATEGQHLQDIAIQPGETRHFRDVRLTDARYQTHLLIVWRRGEDEPIYLATSETSVVAGWRLYRRRPWIEEMFGDMKGNGFDLEKSRLGNAERLSRLMLVVSLVYVWLMAAGEHVLQHGLRKIVDRADRRDLSVFRLGWDYVLHRLNLDRPIPDRLRPIFCQVSGN